MRRANDLPPRRRSLRPTGRGILITLAVLLFGVIVFGRAIARFYIDYLWHEALGRTDVFWGVIGAKLTLFAMFFVAFVVIAGINLFLADRAAPTSFPANVHPYVERFHEVFGQRLRLVRYGTALLLGLILALPAVAQWQDWLLFRNSRSFGVDEPQFGADVGFYVFELPFLAFALDWLFAAVIVVLLLTLAAHLLNGGVLFMSATPTIRPSTKAHLAVLLAVLAVLKAGDYWLTRYELTNSRRGFVQGATYAVVNAQIPALMLLVMIALLTAGLYLWSVKSNSWRLPLIASGLWFVVMIVGGVIYPALVQSLVVNPNQGAREAPFIERNVTATRVAMGIVDVREEPVEFDSLTTAEVEADIEPLTNVRLLNPVEMLSRFRVDRGEVAGLSIDDLDVDRYEVDGEIRQALVAARELDIDGVANQTWQGRHLVNTRGCDVVLAPVNQVTSSDRPAYLRVELERPELYFSPSLTTYAIAGTTEVERECGDDSPYSGEAGVPMSSFFRRAAFALSFLEYNIVGSGAIQPDSQMLWVRDVRDRVIKLAPFLSYDGDPYPVIVDGHVQWIIDAYSTTSRYPYAQRIGNVQLTAGAGLPRDANYVRNSIKAVVDAYDGSVTLYVIDPDDPIVQAWRGAFPDLFAPIEEMPEGLRVHLRYPEDLFRVQTDVYSKYRLAPENFFQRAGAWSVAQAPSLGPRITNTNTNTGTPDLDATSDFASESAAARFVPYYTLFRGLDDEFEFALLRPFVPFSRDDSRTELQAYMTASSDPDTYGQLTAYVVQGVLPDGPVRVTSQAESEPAIRREITLQDNSEGGTAVRFGDLQLIPVGNGLIHVRPFYVEVQQPGPIPVVTEYRFVIVSHDEQAAFAPTMSEALADLFPGFSLDVGDRVVVDGDPDSGFEPEPETEEPAEPVDPDDVDAPDTTRPPLGDDATAAALLAEAETLFIEAEAELRATGDLGAYQAKVEEAQELVSRALALIEGP